MHSLGGAIGGAIGSGRALRPAEAELETAAFEGKDTAPADEKIAQRRGAIGVYWLLVAAVTILGSVGLSLSQDMLWGVGLVFLGFPLIQLVASLLSLAYCLWHKERLKALGTVTLWSFGGGVLIWLPIVAFFLLQGSL